VAKRCGLCRFSADEEAAFVEHMQSVHQWGEAVLHLRSALAKHRLRLIIASPVLFAFLPSGIGDFGRLLIIFVTGELLLVHALVTAKGPLWARMIGPSRPPWGRWRPHPPGQVASRATTERERAARSMFFVRPARSSDHAHADVPTARRPRAVAGVHRRHLRGILPRTALGTRPACSSSAASTAALAFR